VPAVLPALPVAVAEFDCPIEPLSPGLLILIEMTMFWACWPTEATASAACCAAASTDDATSLEPCPGAAAASFDAPACDVASLACEIAPSLPGLSTRIDTTIFRARCVVSPAAAAAWSTADWA
jgi:hypothetical protein